LFAFAQAHEQIVNVKVARFQIGIAGVLRIAASRFVEYHLWQRPFVDVRV
jgi:hypothetical protein